MTKNRKSLNLPGRKILMAFDWYDVGLHQGIASYAREKGWLLNTHMARTKQFPIGWEGDGVIGLITSEATLDFVRNLQLPTVDMGGHFSDFPQVLADHNRLGALAAEHFLERNHRNFVFFRVMNSRLEKEVSTGFIQALESTGHTCEIKQWTESVGETQIRYREVMEWAKSCFEELPRPLAVFCQNDDTAALLLTAALEAGCSIPEEVAILGSGNSEIICESLPVTLSSIGSNMKGVGYRLAELLDGILAGAAPPKVPLRVQPGRSHVRQSTDFLAVKNPHVLKVLRKIWTNYAEPLSIDSLRGLVTISRSGLYNAFIEEVGHPMGKELTRIRILKAKDILAETDLPATEIARQTGFNSLISFSRAFSQNAGMSPMAWRKHVRSHLPEIQK